MKKIDMYQKTCGWQNVYKELTSGMTQTEADGIFDRAFRIYDETARRYGACKGIKRVHVMSAVAEGALYLALKDVAGSERALEMITEGAKPAAVKKHDKIERLPAPVFMMTANIITSIMFGEKAGFKRRWICNTPDEKRFDLLTCPYAETLTEMGCPEACGAICIQDVYSFSEMKNGVSFERTGTIGNGDSCCDFGYIYRGGKK